MDDVKIENSDEQNNKTEISIGIDDEDLINTNNAITNNSPNKETVLLTVLTPTGSKDDPPSAPNQQQIVWLKRLNYSQVDAIFNLLIIFCFCFEIYSYFTSPIH